MSLALLAALAFLAAGCGSGGHPRCSAIYAVTLSAVTMQCPETGHRIFTLDEVVTATFRTTDERSGETIQEFTIEYETGSDFIVQLRQGRPKHVFLRLCRANGDCVEAEAVVHRTGGSTSCGTRVEDVVSGQEEHGGRIGLTNTGGWGGFILATDPDVCAELIADMDETTTTSRW